MELLNYQRRRQFTFAEIDSKDKQREYEIHDCYSIDTTSDGLSLVQKHATPFVDVSTCNNTYTNIYMYIYSH